MKLNINRLYAGIFKIWRKKRFNIFLNKISPTRAMSLLDVGGYPSSWTQYKPVVGCLDILNIHPIELAKADCSNYNMRAMIGDGCNLDFPNNSYDIVFSNSVIEHVGSYEKQKAFASEVRRVGKSLWIQTPAYECLIEPHYLAPFIHWLPKKWQKKLVRHFTIRGLLDQPTSVEVDNMVETTRLLSFKEFKNLFPDCEILIEKMLFSIPKSYIAVRKHIE
jgi:ubiquinone/menaquinone biosynthesis C-methylase UbiE